MEKHELGLSQKIIEKLFVAALESKKYFMQYCITCDDIRKSVLILKIFDANLSFFTQNIFFSMNVCVAVYRL